MLKIFGTNQTPRGSGNEWPAWRDYYNTVLDQRSSDNLSDNARRKPSPVQDVLHVKL
jgi:hypothetical protein